ncbi:Rv3654c family TadE-like protein [Thermostaphylospora chromogena]|uniref:Helicase/secretion neighborhood TadE-like protein n=1 Tax=Thermostaphylospora chromogena TaxID=35622 RepID=A0A1H1DCR8_9ACTN|nr:Rv3654c family TadE-like protein [Thermostaphylospora chromogena]SDQ74180.1 helicase/secretion neighborhood TadE-like protein [Thermostaphylospora chromogena]
MREASGKRGGGHTAGGAGIGAGGDGHSVRPRRCRRKAGRACPAARGSPGRSGSVGWSESAERGSATVWAVALMALLMAVAVVFTYAGMARVARHRAQSAADLSALAAARLAVEGEERACSAARSLARMNRSALDHCSVRESVAEVEVTVRFAPPVVPERLIHARARAGPVEGAITFAPPSGASPPPSGSGTAPRPGTTPVTNGRTIRSRQQDRSGDLRAAPR